MRFYSAEEIRGALVIDSEALIYGVVEGIRVCGSTVCLVVYEAGRRAVDREELLRRLRSAGAGVGEEEPLERLVEEARRLRLEIPWRDGVRMLKALVPVEEVKVVDRARLEWEGVEEDVAVVLLRTPREARYRGRVESGRPELVDERRLRGMLVVSASRGVLGRAGEVVVGPGEFGLRVYKSTGVRKYLNWAAFLSEVRSRGYRELYSLLAERWNPLKYTRLPAQGLAEVRRAVEEAGGPREVLELLEKHVVRERVGAQYVDVPWSRVLKVGDVVIVE